MFNSKYLEVTEDLKQDFQEAFKSENEKQIFLFFRKFLNYIENDDLPYNRTFIMENPLNKSQQMEFLNSFNQKCHDFLVAEIQKDDVKKESKRLKSDAYNYIGVGYEYGLFNFPKNKLKAFENYTISAQLYNDLGTFKLAQCFEDGSGTKKDSKKALCFYRCAAKLGLADAMHAYGTILCNGYVGAEHDCKTGFYYLKAASERSSVLCPYPLYDLGMYYASSGETDEPRDDKYALEVFKKGAEYGDPNCQYKLGQIYEFGDLSCEIDQAKSLEYYIMAATNGHVDAQVKMSRNFLEGIPPIINRNLLKSFRWALRAGSKGETQATFILGEYAETGTGTKKDILHALFWFQISEKLGNKKANIKVAQLTKDVLKIDTGADIPTPCCGSFLCW